MFNGTLKIWGIQLKDIRLHNSNKWAVKDPSVSVNFVNAAIQGARNKNLNITNILESVGIKPHVLEEPKARVSPEQYSRLIQELWRVTKDEFLGLTSKPCPLGAFSYMAFSVINCENLGHLIKRMNKFYQLLGNDIDILISEDEDVVFLSFNIGTECSDPFHFLTESYMTILHRFSSWLIGQRIVIDQALFNYSAPTHAEEYGGIFCPNIYFDEKETGIKFHKRYLDMPITQSEMMLREYLKRSPANIVVRPYSDNSYTARVRSMLNVGVEQKNLSLEQVADNLHTTASSLRRYLKIENTSYQIIKDGIRRDMAIYMLTETQLSLQDISVKLGYSESSAFQHTFKKWTGLSPGAYRNR